MRRLLIVLALPFAGWKFPEEVIAVMKYNMAAVKAVLHWAAANYFPFAGRALVWVQDKLDGAFELALKVALWKVPAAEKAHTELVARFLSHQSVFLGLELLIGFMLAELLLHFVIWPIRLWWRRRRDRLYLSRDPYDPADH